MLQFVLAAFCALLVHEATAQAPTLDFLCVAFCPNNKRYLPSIGESACRYGQADCLSWAGLTRAQAGLGCDFGEANFNIFKFGSSNECKRYEEVIRSTTTGLSTTSKSNSEFGLRKSLQALALFKSDADNTNAEDATCSCHSIVNTFFDSILETLPPAGSTPRYACTYIKNKMMAKLQTSVCKVKRVDKTGVIGSVCKLAFNVVEDLFEPAEDAAVAICASFLQALFDNFGFGSSINDLLNTIHTAGNATRTAMAEKLCGATVCTSSTQNTCTAYVNAADRKTALAAAVDSNRGLCKLLEAVSDAASSSTCFPAYARVLREGGHHVRMDELRTGDRILTASGEYVEVFFFSHKSATQRGSFVKLHTNTTGCVEEACVPLVVTMSHYVRLFDGSLKVASQIVEGDQLRIAADNSSAAVVMIEQYQGQGLYNPHVVSGADIVVDGYVVSTLTNSVHPRIANFGLSSLEMLHKLGVPVDNELIDGCMRLVEPMASSVSSVIASN